MGCIARRDENFSKRCKYSLEVCVRTVPCPRVFSSGCLYSSLLANEQSPRVFSSGCLYSSLLASEQAVWYGTVSYRTVHTMTVILHRLENAEDACSTK